MAQQSPAPDRTGSCLCGAIQIRIRGGEPPLRTNLCHCSSCQKSTGSVLASLAVFKSDQVTYEASDPSLLRTYDDASPESGAVLERAFCGRCGSHVRITRRPGGGSVVVPVGAIDGDRADLKPALEYFCARKAAWLGDVQGAERFEKLPPPPPPPPPPSAAA